MNAFGNIPKCMKLEGGTYIFCVSSTINIQNMCQKFGYEIQGNPILRIIDSGKYNSLYNVSENFHVTLANSEES